MKPGDQQFSFDFGDSADGGATEPSAGSAKRRSPKAKATRAKRKPSPEDAISVGELTAQIKSVVESSLSTLWVSGEITDIARPRSGHLYFTLKDDRATMRGVMWRSTAERLAFELEDGQKVLCFGDVEVYAARGSVQLVVRKCQPQGIGPLQLAFAQLRAKLDAEGLFDPSRKRPLPRIPKRIAIVTSPAGAAIHDFLQAAKARHAGVEIVLIPASVQGPGSVPTLIDGIRWAHQLRPRPDVLIVSRGGGSLEDLWSFNEEALVRALAASQIPTVSAVGHEVDVTLSDLVADVRALTPTDAASRVLPDRDALLTMLNTLRSAANTRMRQRIDRAAERLRWLQSRPVLRTPLVMVHDRNRRLDELDLRCRRGIDRTLDRCEHRLKTAAASVAALSPLSVLARGYTVTQTESGDVLRSLDDLELGQTLRTRTTNGEFRSQVTEISPNE